MHRHIFTFLILGFLACGEKNDETSSDEPQTVEGIAGTSVDNSLPSDGKRPFYLAFTPWLNEATLTAEDSVYDFIQTNGDMIAHHFQQGIPYDDALTFPNFDNYHQNIKDEVINRLNKTSSDMPVYLAIDSLNGSRDALTDFWGENANTPRSAPWDSRRLSHPDVITAYVNFSLEMIARFNPVYFNYAPEVSDLIINNVSEFDEFKDFAAAVYTQIKSAYPDLKMIVSVALKTPGSSDMNAIQSRLGEILEYVDTVGISTYGYAFYDHAVKGNPDHLPDDWLTQILEIAPEKSYAIVETGWIAEDLAIPVYGLDVQSSEILQNNYVKKMFTDAKEISAEAIIWFASHDYDVLWSDTLGQDDLSKVWKDTGFVDQDLNERLALDTWQDWLSIARE
ncbi:hypothetical protein N9D31_03935 [Oligoflexaceae bacterium]|nr:hypothetical protein [Oligoflexaceae bacterium]